MCSKTMRPAPVGILDLHVVNYSPSLMISMSILGQRSQNAYRHVKAKPEVAASSTRPPQRSLFLTTTKLLKVLLGKIEHPCQSPGINDTAFPAPFKEKGN